MAALLFGALGGALLLTALPGPASAQYAEVTEVRDRLRAGQSEEAVEAAETLLSRDDLPAALRNAVLELLARAHLRARDRDAAQAVLEGLYARDPGHRLTDPDATRGERRAFSRVQQEPPESVQVDLLHEPLGTLDVREAPEIRVRLSAAGNAVAEVWLQHRRGGGGDWSRIQMELEGDSASARIPLPEDATGEIVLEYHVVARAPSGAELARLGTGASPLSVTVPERSAAPVLEVGDGPADTQGDDGEDTGGGVLGTWWFWTAVGVILVGGAVAAVLLLDPFSAEEAPDGSLGNIQLLTF